MVEFFNKQEFFDAKKQRRKVLAWYFVFLALYVIGSAVVFYWYKTLPYMSKDISKVKAVQYSITGIFVVFSFIYLGIPFKRINKYYKLMLNIMTGLKETSTGSFFEYDESIRTKDGVECKSLVFLEWNKFKKDFYERHVLIHIEREFPKLEKHENVRYVTQGNMLYSYEVIE